jgi:predicted MPP superfamily phosphohydrolase
MVYRIALGVLAFLLTVYAMWIEPNWIQINHHDMRSNKDTDRIRIVQLSDLHIQQMGEREIAVVDQVKALTADLVVLSGDVIDKPDRLPELHKFLGALVGTPTVAVLGNWEYWSGVDLGALREEYHHHGIRLLVNDRTSYQVRQRTLHVLGIDDFTAGDPDYRLLNMPIEEETSILVQHSPGYFDRLPADFSSDQFRLCIAGHTHGGQITLLGRPLWKPPGSGSFASGLYDTRACKLFVSKGIGTSLLPIRFGARPEIAVFDL